MKYQITVTVQNLFEGTLDNVPQSETSLNLVYLYFFNLKLSYQYYSSWYKKYENRDNFYFNISLGLKHIFHCQLVRHAEGFCYKMIHENDLVKSSVLFIS